MASYDDFNLKYLADLNKQRMSKEDEKDYTYYNNYNNYNTYTPNPSNITPVSDGSSNNEESKRSFLDRALSLFGNESITSAIYNATDNDESTTVAGGVTAGLHRMNPFADDVEDSHTFSDILTDNVGWKPDTALGKVAKFGVGLAGDILLDPLTYIPIVGAANAIIKGTGKAAKALNGVNKFSSAVASAEKISDASKAFKAYNTVATGASETLKAMKNASNIKLLTYDDALKVVKSTRASGSKSTMSVEEEARKLCEDFNHDLFGVVKEEKIANGRGLSIGLDLLPFASKVPIGSKKAAAFKKELISEMQLREFGDKTIAPYYNGVVNSIKGAVNTERFSKFAKKFNLENKTVFKYDRVRNVIKEEGSKEAASLYYMSRLLDPNNSKLFGKKLDTIQTASEIRKLTDGLSEDEVSEFIDLVESGVMRDAYSLREFRESLKNSGDSIDKLSKDNSLKIAYDSLVKSIYERRNSPMLDRFKQVSQMEHYPSYVRNSGIAKAFNVDELPDELSSIVKNIDSDSSNISEYSNDLFKYFENNDDLVDIKPYQDKAKDVLSEAKNALKKTKDEYIDDFTDDELSMIDNASFEDRADVIRRIQSSKSSTYDYFSNISSNSVDEFAANLIVKDIKSGKIKITEDNISELERIAHNEMLANFYKENAEEIENIIGSGKYDELYNLLNREYSKIGAEEVGISRLSESRYKFNDGRYLPHVVRDDIDVSPSVDPSLRSRGYSEVLGHKRDYDANRKLKTITGNEDVLETDLAKMFLIRKLKHDELINTEDTLNQLDNLVLKRNKTRDSQIAVVPYNKIEKAIDNSIGYILSKNGLNAIDGVKLSASDFQKIRNDVIEYLGLDNKMFSSNIPLIELDNFKNPESLSDLFSFTNKQHNSPESIAIRRDYFNAVIDSFMRNNCYDENGVIYDGLEKALNLAQQAKNNALRPNNRCYITSKKYNLENGSMIRFATQDTINELNRLSYQQIEDNKSLLTSVFDGLTQKYKKFKTMYNPGFIPQNGLGNFINSWLGCSETLYNPKLQKKAFDILRYKDPKQTITVAGQKLTHEHIYNIAKELGIFEENFAQQELKSGALTKAIKDKVDSNYTTVKKDKIVGLMNRLEQNPNIEKEIADAFYGVNVAPMRKLVKEYGSPFDADDVEEYAKELFNIKQNITKNDFFKQKQSELIDRMAELWDGSKESSSILGKMYAEKLKELKRETQSRMYNDVADKFKLLGDKIIDGLRAEPSTIPRTASIEKKVKTGEINPVIDSANKVIDSYNGIVGDSVSKLDNKLVELTSTQENAARLSLFINALNTKNIDGTFKPLNTETYLSAKKTVDDFLFDYNDITDIERDVLKRVIPFWTWMRKNSILQLNQMIENSNKLIILNKAGRSLDNAFNNTDDNYTGYGTIGSPFEGIFIKPNVPTTQLDKVNSIGKVFNQTNPMLKIPVESLIGVNGFGEEVNTGTEIGNAISPQIITDLVNAAKNGDDSAIEKLSSLLGKWSATGFNYKSSEGE